MAMGDRGLACPVSFPPVSRSCRISPPAPSTTGPPHKQTIHERARAAPRKEGIIPNIHRALSMERRGRAGRCCEVRRGQRELKPVEDRGMGGAMARAAKQEALPEAGWEAIPDEPSGIEAYVIGDDGLIPNNAKLPLVLYRQALALDGLSSEPERAFEALFRSNGWRGAWVDGIYDFDHYHSTAHEVLGMPE